MKNVAQRLRRPHDEGVGTDKRQPVACCECGDACEYHPEYDPSPEHTKCYGCAEAEARQQERERDEEAATAAEWEAMMRSEYRDEDLDGVRW